MKQATEQPVVSRRRFLAACSLAVLCHIGLLVHGNLVHFPNVDEVAHLPAGVSKWRQGTFELYRVNPPLTDLVAGLGALTAADRYAWEKLPVPLGTRPEFEIGSIRLREVGLALHRDFIVPRLLLIPFSLLGCGLLTWLAYRELGAGPAVVVCWLWCFCPNLLAHAQTVIPDVPSVAVGLVPSIALLAYVRQPGWERAIGVGLALGLAMYSKLTWMTGMVSLPITAAVAVAIGPANRRYFYSPRRIVRDFLLMALAALFFLNQGYLLDGTGTPLGEYRFGSPILGGEDATPWNPGNRFADTPLAQLPVPLPYDYVMGIDYLKYEVETGYWSFLRGEWRQGSWWYYYLYTTLVKTPLALLVAALPATYLLIRRWSPAARQAWAVLALPALIAFASISWQGGFNHHHRYVLMIYPPLYLLIGGAFQISITHRWFRAAMLGLCGLAVAASLSVWPHFLTFFNRLAGGPEHGWQVLDFSNVDWGQDLLMVDRWLTENSDKRPCALATNYFNIDGRYFGLTQQRIPTLKLRAEDEDGDHRDGDQADSPATGDRPEPVGISVAGEDSGENDPLDRVPEAGWYVISVRSLNDKPGFAGLGYFRLLEPVDRIGYTYLVYRLDDAARRRIAARIDPSP